LYRKRQARRGSCFCHLQRYAGGAYASRTGSRQQSMFAVDAGQQLILQLLLRC
jgi:hypothetical protein